MHAYTYTYIYVTNLSCEGGIAGPRGGGTGGGGKWEESESSAARRRIRETCRSHSFHRFPQSALGTGRKGEEGRTAPAADFVVSGSLVGARDAPPRTATLPGIILSPRAFASFQEQSTMRPRSCRLPRVLSLPPPSPPSSFPRALSPAASLFPLFARYHSDIGNV